VAYIHYQRNRLSEALLELHDVVEARRNDLRALYAMANTLYLRGDFFAAQGFYSRLVELLEERRRSIPLLRPEEDPEHQALLALGVRAYNNLGVTLERLAQAGRSPERQSQALAELTRSMEYYDLLSRDPETLVRALRRNREGMPLSGDLAYLNSREIVYPDSSFALEIHKDIPKDLDESVF
jgi:tetratricopeptide (TPR) repeat protein